MKDYSKKLTSEQKTVKAFTDPLNKQIERLTLENKKLTDQLRIAVVSKRFSENEMLKIAQDWANERSDGDTKQDADCCYDYVQGLRAMNRLK